MNTNIVQHINNFLFNLFSFQESAPYSKIPRKPVSKIPQTTSSIATATTGTTTRKQNTNYQSRIERPSMSTLLRPPQKVAAIPRSISGDTLDKISKTAAVVTATTQKTGASSVSSRLKNINLRNNDIISKINQNVIDDNTKMLIDETMDLIGSDDNLKVSGQNETVTLSTNGNVTYEVHKNNQTHLLQNSKILTNSLDSLNMASSSKTELNDSAYDLDKTIVGAVSKDSIFIDNQNILNSTHLVLHNLTLDLNTDATFKISPSNEHLIELNSPHLEKSSIKLNNFNKRMLFNSTMNNNLLLDITQAQSPTWGFNMTNDLNSAGMDKNTTKLLYMTTVIDNTLDNREVDDTDCDSTGTDMLKMEVDEPMADNKYEQMMDQDRQQSATVQMRPVSEGKTPVSAKQRYSFGLDLTECTLDCSIEFCDLTVSSAQQPSKSPCNSINIQNSFDLDESLGILTPDQMKEFLDSNTTNTNLDLPFGTASLNHKATHHQCRIDQTPSPEELPLDPVGVKTDTTDCLIGPENIQQAPAPHMIYQEVSQADSDSKTDQMTKSATSKVSNSFITSITSITSLDTGYQGDGEMSRPASRGADHSPSIGPKIKPAILNNPNNHNNNLNWNVNAPGPVARRQDPMTDSDFFTESDADDVFNRGDRRAQVIDGQLYGPMLQGANVFINQQPQTEDSCMESSGIFTDVENRGDDDLLHRLENSQKHHHHHHHNHNHPVNNSSNSDMSPDISSDTISSSNTTCSQKQMKMDLMSTTPNDDGQSPQQQLHQPLLESNDSTLINRTKLSSSSASCLNVDTIVVSCAGVGSGGVGTNSDIDTVNLISDATFGSAQKLPNNDTNVIIDTTRSLSTESSPLSFHHKNSNNNNLVSKKFTSARKQLKNETNLGLKKHEMSTRNVSKFSKIMGKTIPNNSDSNNSNIVISDKSACVLGGGSGDQENQENKRPGAPKKCLVNKWDAVMNKIAENKTTTVKKNLSTVKSKVACGVPKRSPRLLNTPPSEDQSVCSGASSLMKRTASSSKR